MINTSRCREKLEGWLGRKRWYNCRKCGSKFQVDTLNPLPENQRLCLICKVGKRTIEAREESDLIKTIDKIEESLEEVRDRGHDMNLRAVAVEHYNKSVKTIFPMMDRKIQEYERSR